MIIQEEFTAIHRISYSITKVDNDGKNDLFPNSINFFNLIKTLGFDHRVGAKLYRDNVEDNKYLLTL